MATSKKQRKQLDGIEGVKRLLILMLAKQGATSDEIGKVLEVDSSSIRHIVPFRSKKKSEK